MQYAAAHKEEKTETNMLYNADHKEVKQDNNVRYYTEHKEEIRSRRIGIRAQEKERMKMIFEEARYLGNLGDSQPLPSQFRRPLNEEQDVRSVFWAQAGEFERRFELKDKIRDGTVSQECAKLFKDAVSGQQYMEG